MLANPYATMEGDMFHANRATLIAPFERLLRNISPSMVAVFWQCLSSAQINSARFLLSKSAEFFCLQYPE